MEDSVHFEHQYGGFPLDIHHLQASHVLYSGIPAGSHSIPILMYISVTSWLGRWHSAGRSWWSEHKPRVGCREKCQTLHAAGESQEQCSALSRVVSVGKCPALPTSLSGGTCPGLLQDASVLQPSTSFWALHPACPTAGAAAYIRDYDRWLCDDELFLYFKIVDNYYYKQVKLKVSARELRSAKVNRWDCFPSIV